MYKKSCEENRRAAWMNKDILVKLTSKKKMCRQWSQRHIYWEDCRDIAQICRSRVRKAKEQLELNLARSMNNTKKGFCRYFGQKMNIKESVIPTLMSRTGAGSNWHGRWLIYSTVFCRFSEVIPLFKSLILKKRLGKLSPFYCKRSLKKEENSNKTLAVRSRVYRECLDCEKGIPLLVSCVCEHHPVLWAVLRVEV